MTAPSIEGEVVIVGSGVAGLSAALELASHEPPPRVLLLTRGKIGWHGASPLAQGGVAAAIDPSDSPELHAQDTEAAAAGLARSELVRILTDDAPDRVRELIRIGARFDRSDSGDLSLGLEGAHSRNRILHAQGDRTGAEVTRALRDAVLECPTVEIVEDVEVLTLRVADGRVWGVLARDAEGTVRAYDAPATLLATGGPGRVFLYSTAPPGMQGDGLAMAARAGAALRDLEFVQFHPTALNVDTDPLPLVTEALRGAGARLVDGEGHPVLNPDEGDELAPRDWVARAIWRLVQAGGKVFLDARKAPGARIPEAFPGVYQLCRSYGIDPVTDLVPVTPAAHYHMGGIAVDAEGRTTVPGLWAAGEVAASGLHGANRLASNSLLEGLVFGPIAARSMRSHAAEVPKRNREPEPSASTFRAPPPLPPEIERRIRTLMWEQVGIVRNGPALARAIRELQAMELFLGSPAGVSYNLLLSARLIARAALLREESIGSHYRDDFPERGEGPPRHSVLTLDGGRIEADPAETMPA